MKIRNALAEYLVRCKRLDKVKIPFLGLIGSALTLGMWDGRIGKVHLGVVTYTAMSTAQSPLIVDRWWYRGHDLYKAYDTEQIFTSKPDAAPYSYLSPWHMIGRYAKKSTWQRLLEWVRGDVYQRPAIAPAPRLRPLVAIRDADLRWMAARNLVTRGFL